MPMPLGLPPPVPGFELFVASHGMSEGLSQTDGPQVIPRLTIRMGELQLCAQWRNVSSHAASGIAAFFVKWSHKRGDTQLDFATLYRVRTAPASGLVHHAWEFDGAFRHSFGKFGVRAIAEFAPKEFDAGSSFYGEIGPTLQVGRTTTASTNIGRRQRDGAPNYTTFNAGVTRLVGGKLSLDARVYGTDRARLGSRYRTRFIVSARVVLRAKGKNTCRYSTPSRWRSSLA